MTTLDELSVRLTAEVAPLQRALQTGSRALKKYETDVNGSAGNMATRFGGLAGVFTKVGGAGVGAALAIGAAMAKGAQDVAGIETRMLKLDNIIKTTGRTAGLTAEQIADFADGLEKSTMATQEGIMDAAGVLLTFKSVAGETFTKTLELAQDLAATGFGSLEDNAVKLGKALEDPVNGLGALKKMGVSFSATQKEMIQNFVATGQLAKAQGEILEAVAGKVGGAGKGESAGLAGAFKHASDQMGDFFENIAQKSGVLDGLKKALDGIAERLAEVNETDPLAIHERSLDEYKKKLEDVNKLLKNVDGKSKPDFERNKAAYEKEIKDLELTINTMKYLREEEEKRVQTKAAIVQKEIAEQKASEATAETRQKESDQAKDALKDLQRKAALMGDLTELETLRARISIGDLKVENVELQKQLEYWAEIIDKKNAAADTTRRDDAAEGLADLEMSLGTPEQRNTRHENEFFAEQMNAANEARATGLIDMQGYLDLEQQIVRDHEEELAKIRGESDKKNKNRLNTMFDFFNASEEDRADAVEHAEEAMQHFRELSMGQQANIVTGGLGKMTAALGQHSRAFFNINKVAGIANAIVNTAQGVTEALKLPPPMSFAVAAATAAAGAAQIMTIKSQQFGGGGKTPSVPQEKPPTDTGDSGATVKAAPVPQAPNITFALPEDELMSTTAFRNFLRKAARELKDMGVNSYQLAV